MVEVRRIGQRGERETPDKHQIGKATRRCGRKEHGQTECQHCITYCLLIMTHSPWLFEPDALDPSMTQGGQGVGLDELGFLAG